MCNPPDYTDYTVICRFTTCNPPVYERPLAEETATFFIGFFGPNLIWAGDAENANYFRFLEKVRNAGFLHGELMEIIIAEKWEPWEWLRFIVKCCDVRYPSFVFTRVLSCFFCRFYRVDVHRDDNAGMLEKVSIHLKSYLLGKVMQD